MNGYEKLLSPIKIRNTVFKNRIGAAPTTPFFYTNESTRPSEEYIEDVVSKARGGMHFGSKSLEYYRCVVGNFRLEENAKAYLNTRCVEAGPDYVIIEKDGETETIPVDTILVSTGMEARTDEALALWQSGVRNDLIGDWVKAEDIEAATRTAYDAAVNIGG